MNNKWYNFEGLVQISMIVQSLDYQFKSGDHPSLDTYEKTKLYHEAVEALTNLYQKISEGVILDEN